jgi:G3E family GTPase
VIYATGLGTTSTLECLLSRVSRVPGSLDDSHHQGEHGADSLHTHMHTHSHLDSTGIQTFTVVRDDPIPGAALTLFVQALSAQLGVDLLRVKGLICLAESPQQPMLLQGAQRVFHPLLELDAWPRTHKSHTRMVFIVRGGPARHFVEQLFDALIWEVSDISVRLRQSRSVDDIDTQPKESSSCLI